MRRAATLAPAYQKSYLLDWVSGRGARDTSRSSMAGSPWFVAHRAHWTVERAKFRRGGRARPRGTTHPTLIEPV